MYILEIVKNRPRKQNYTINMINYKEDDKSYQWRIPLKTQTVN